MVYVPIIINTSGSLSSVIGTALGVCFAWGIIFTIYGIHFSRPWQKGARWDWDKQTIALGLLLNLAGVIGLVATLTFIK